MLMDLGCQTYTQFNLKNNTCIFQSLRWRFPKCKSRWFQNSDLIFDNKILIDFCIRLQIMSSKKGYKINIVLAKIKIGALKWKYLILLQASSSLQLITIQPKKNTKKQLTIKTNLFYINIYKLHWVDFNNEIVHIVQCA